MIFVTGASQKAVAHGGENHAEPVEGFITEEVSAGWNAVMGMRFGPNAAGTKIRQYVWEKRGMVWVVEDGQKQTPALLDLREEVGNWRDHGLMSVVLDPDFRSNGFIYLLYAVDRHHLLHHGTPAYDPQSDDFFSATIGRVTRYQADAANDFLTIDPASRTVLLGATPSTGFPILYESHGAGSLQFAKDGSLLVSAGDGASYSDIDTGGAMAGSYAPEAVVDGIIRPDEDVGVYRSQLLDSLSGKILRIDPDSGLGYPSNPFFETSDPASTRSRIWALGFRNPFRFCIRSDSGSHNPADGDPGCLLVGDVGWNAREETNVVDVPGRNAGWPLYEGMDPHPTYNAQRPAGIPAIPTWRPMIEWRWSARVCLDNINVYPLGDPSSPVAGSGMIGHCSVAGVWYDGDSFPESYRDSFFFSDFNNKWVRNIRFDSNNIALETQPFLENAGYVSSMAVHPGTGDLYYTEYPDTIHRVFYRAGGAISCQTRLRRWMSITAPRRWWWCFVVTSRQIRQASH